MSKEVDDDDESAACAPHPKTLMLIRLPDVPLGKKLPAPFVQQEKSH
ncbi:hypothetical protein IEC97_08190 [Neobacillus cucumis]|nr:hypothetical protein [Neobacillus cucumis]MBI0577338.1 hypothetical protein [Neobacillus cucumis]